MFFIIFFRYTPSSRGKLTVYYALCHRTSWSQSLTHGCHVSSLSDKHGMHLPTT